VSAERDPHQGGALQHDAEHERPHKKNSVLFYLMILFAAAFLLLLLSYFMQQRANQEALDDLEQTSNSAVESLENLIAERDALKLQVSALEAERDTLQAEWEASADTAQKARDGLMAAMDQVDALNKLNQLRTLYNQRRYSQARTLLAEWEAAAPGALEASLQAVSDAMGPAERELYDPLEAYRQLSEWLEQ